MEACIRGDLIDRPPVALWRHFPVDDQSPQTLAEAHLDFQKRYDFDFIKITPASSFSVRDWGVEDSWEGSTEGTRTYTKRAIHAASDWEKLSVLDPSSHHLARQLECIKLIRGKIGMETPILQTVFNPLSQAKHLAGEATLVEHLREHPRAVQTGLGIITQSTRRFIEAVAGLGVDGIFYAVQHAQKAVMPEDEFVRWSRESDMLLLRAAGSLWCNMLHVHGEQIYFESFRDYPAHIINWHDRETGPALSEAGSTWPLAMCGGLSRKSLVFGTAEDLSREAADILAGPYCGRIVLSTGCVVPIIAPHGNLLAAKQAAGSYSAAGNRLGRST
jgi:uroporphyrinogen decarboxylase